MIRRLTLKFKSSFLRFTRKESTEPEATISIKACELHRIDTSPSTETVLTRSDGLAYYDKMVVMRRMEQTAGHLYQEKLIKGFCHLYTGQEAVAVGMYAAMRPFDTIITSYRAHGWMYITSSEDVNTVLCELLGKVTGCSRGKGGSMHLFNKIFFGGNAIVGAQVPLGTGIALGHKMKRTGGVSFTLYGDGAANQGQAYEAMNMAYIWKLPCVFVCENNHYGMGTSTERASGNIQFYQRGDVIPGLRVDGMDVLATREATDFAIDYCTSGAGPILLEMTTYRYVGHSVSDPGTTYRKREEIEEVRAKHDCIAKLKLALIHNNLATEDELKEIDNSAKTLIADAVNKAKNDPDPPLEELTSDIYLKCDEPFIRGCQPSIKYKHSRTRDPLY